MNRFEAHNISTADVPAPRTAIWEVLSSPETLAELTPLLDAITVDGDKWCWQLGGISALGVEIAPSFTETMASPPRRPSASPTSPRRVRPSGPAPTASTPSTAIDPDTTHLEIDITLHVELPAAAGVTPGSRAHHVVDHDPHRQHLRRAALPRLGIDPAKATQTTVRA